MKKNSRVRKLYKILRKVQSYKETMAAMSDQELAGLTPIFKDRLSKGETLDDLLPEAFAAICEVDKRILGMFPYDVQIVGGIALHQGYLAEMNTGEGKTLTATMPLYLNALTGRGTFLLTNNDYLALRDVQEMGPVYEFMGLTVRAGVPDRNQEDFTNEDKKAVYAADIVYSTHGALGFDYLFNNLVSSAEERFQRDFYYCIIDEADAVLLDSATMPLVIAGSPRVQSNLYGVTDFFITTLVENVDYEVEDKKVWLTEEGARRCEEFFGIDNFYGEEHFEINRHVTLALMAHKTVEKQKDYVITNENEMVLLDGESGRMMNGVKLRGGIHQAIEAKEKVEISQETRSVASVTYQYLFQLFEKMSGMSGTIADAKEELLNIYGKKTVVIPPNCPIKRKDLRDLYFANATDQIYMAVNEILKLHAKGQPVLVVASAIKDTEILSRLLINEQIPHNVLNANNAYWEAEIIKEAGQMDAVTVSTSMAGRGTDIKLGEGVKELGGLAVIGIGRLSNTRLERQARGRAGRQGDPGISRFYVSLEDEVVCNNGPEKLEKYIDGKRHMSRHRLKKIINNSQRVGEEGAVASRKSATDYDEVMRYQRELIYEIRGNLLDGGTLSTGRFRSIAAENIAEFTAQPLDRSDISRYLLDNISYSIDDDFREVSLEDKEKLRDYLLSKVDLSLQRQLQPLGSRKIMGDFVRIATLRAIDEAWVEQVDYLQQLQSAVSGRSSAQRNPVYEYQKDSYKSFMKMKKIIYRNIVRNVLLSEVNIDNAGKLRIVYP